MFIQSFGLYYSRKAVISRLRAKMTSWLGSDVVQYGNKLTHDGSQVIPNKENLVIELRKNEQDASLTVTPALKDGNDVRLMIPMTLVKDQVVPIHSSDERRYLWKLENTNFMGIDREESDHLCFNFKAPIDAEHEKYLHELVKNAVLLADFDVEEIEVRVKPEIICVDDL